jgi:hypothetical protein
MKKLTRESLAFVLAVIVSVFVSSASVAHTANGSGTPGTRMNLTLNVVPAQNAISVNRSSDITVAFGQDMSASTITNSNVRVFGFESGLLSTLVSYNSGNRTATINPVSDFKTGEQIQVTLTSRIRTSSNIPITPFTWTFTVQALSGTGIFTETSVIDSVISNLSQPNALIKSGDIDNDGDLDLLTNGYITGMKIYKNDGIGNFSLSQQIKDLPGVVYYSYIYPGDYDNDGDLDFTLAVTTDLFFIDSLYTYKNDGTGNFTKTSSASGGGLTGSAADLDGDGDLDIGMSFGYDIVLYYINDGNGNFVRYSITDLGYYHTCGFDLGDIDNDGDIDFNVAIKQADETMCKIVLLINDGNANFSIGGTYFINTNYDFYKFIDVNGDNYLDMISSRYFFINNGNGTFSNVYFPVGNLHSGQFPFDLDGDGDIDISYSNLYSTDVLSYKNNAAGSFTYFSSISVGILTNGGVSGDFDSDGDIDLAMNNRDINNGLSDISILMNDHNPQPICDPGTPHIEVLKHPDLANNTLHGEGKLTYRYSDSAHLSPQYVDNHCGLNVIREVDPCNPWELEFYVAYFEDENDKVLLRDAHINWDTTVCQDFRTVYVYPPDYVSNRYYDSVVVKYTMIPHAIDGCNLGGFKNCFYGNVVDTLCWTDCMNERITLECVDSCEIPNRAICNIEYDKPLPVELISFTSTVDKRDVILSWATASENNNLGFDVERKTDGKWSKVGFVKGENSSANYTYVDKNLNSGNYGYRLKQTDFNGNFEYFDLSEAVTIGVPDKFFLEQNYPNPFNPVTTIVYGIPEAGNVTLKVFDMSGREVMTLVSEFKDAGYYTAKFDASGLASGAYFYRLAVSPSNPIETGGFVLVKKLVYLK